jgi:hypothetical protein
MAKALTIFGMVVAGLLGLLFALDIIVGIPFGGAKILGMDVGGLVASGILGYLSFSTFREQR